MTTLATALKSEIVQAAQKTLRAETQALRKAARASERDISALQRRVAGLEHLISRMAQSGGPSSGSRSATRSTSRSSPGSGPAASSRSPRALQQRANGAASPTRVRGGRPHTASQDGGAEGPALRFSAKGFAKLRQRLGLSAAALGTLLGVTAQSVYKWEDGKARPRAAQLQAIAAVRKLGKREAAARLADMAEMEGHEATPSSAPADAVQAAGASGAVRA